MRIQLRYFSAIAFLSVALLALPQFAPAQSNLTRITYGPSSASNGQTTTDGRYSWTAPSGVTSITLSMWGAGGNGGGLKGGNTAGNGGGGGGLLKATVPVTPGQTYYLHVGKVRLAAISSDNAFCTDPDTGTPMNLAIDSWFSDRNSCPLLNNTLYLEVQGGSIGGSGGGTGPIYAWRSDGQVTYYARGATDVSVYRGGAGGTGGYFGGGDCEVKAGGGGGAGGGGLGAAGFSKNGGSNGEGDPSLGGGAGGAPLQHGGGPGGGGGGSCANNNFDVFGEHGRIVLEYTPSIQTPSCTDIGLRVQEAGQTVPTTIAIEPLGTTPMSPLRISKNNQTYGIVLVAPGDPAASAARVKLANGSVMALSRCVPTRNLEYAAQAPTLNFQTSLFEQRLTVTNTTGAPTAAVRATVLRTESDSPADLVQLYNESGKDSNGLPYIQYNLPLAPGQSVTFTAEFYSPTRSFQTAEYSVTSVPPDPAVSLPVNAVPVTIDRGVFLADGTYMLEWSSIANTIYAVQYSDDSGTTWKTVSPFGASGANRIQWVDNGPPKTVSMPTPALGRQYKVWRIP